MKWNIFKINLKAALGNQHIWSYSYIIQISQYGAPYDMWAFNVCFQNNIFFKILFLKILPFFYYTIQFKMVFFSTVMIVFMYFPVKHKSSFPFLKECHSTQLFSFCFCATTFSNLCFTWINSNDLFSNAMHLSWFSKLTWDLSILAIQAMRWKCIL